MYHLLGTVKQYLKFKEQFLPFIPQGVWEILSDRVNILDKYYGKDRNIDIDIGGYCVIFSPNLPPNMNEYREILNKYHLRHGEWEYQEQIATDNALEIWVEELYLVNSEYGIIFFYPLTERQV